MKRHLIVFAVLCGCAAVVILSVGTHPKHASKPFNPYFERYLKNVEACERNSQEWREAEDRAGQEAWQKYGERVSRTGLGQNDCKAEAWASLDYLPFNERIEAQKQIDIALKESSEK